MIAEKQLSAAEKALEHLELALKLSGANMSALLKEKIMPDVDHLKSTLQMTIESGQPLLSAFWLQNSSKIVLKKLN